MIKSSTISNFGINCHVGTQKHRRELNQVLEKKKLKTKSKTSLQNDVQSFETNLASLSVELKLYGATSNLHHAPTY